MTEDDTFKFLRRKPFDDVRAAYKSVPMPDLIYMKNNPSGPLVKAWGQELTRVIEEHGWTKEDFEEMSRVATLREHGAPEEFIFRKRK